MSGILLATVGNSYGSAPVNTVAPVVSGTASFGSTLTTTNGTWLGAPAPTFTYQWQRVTTNISGATSSTYVLVAADVGNTIRCVVRATNSVAPSGVTANSNSTASVAAIVPGAPTIGTATQTGSSTATVVYTAPASDGGATITSYTATSSPAGGTGTLNQAGSGTITVTGLSPLTSYTFTVTATNSAGTSAASAASNSITTDDAYFFGSLYSSVYAGDIFVDSSANIYQSNLTSPPSTLQAVKQNNTAVIQWQKSLASTNPSYPQVEPHGVVVDTSSNVYVLTVSPVTGVNNLYISKYNSSGTLQWQKQYGDAVTGSYVAGTTSLAIDNANNIIFAVANVGNRMGAAKLNSSGTIIWQTFNDIGPGGNSQADVIAVGAGDVPYTAGYLYSGGFNLMYAKLSPTTGLTSLARQVNDARATGIASNTSGDVYLTSSGNAVGVIKFDSSGTFQWNRKITTLYTRGITVDNSGNSYVIGDDNTSTFILKYNSSGTLQWQRSIVTSGNIYTYSVKLNTAGTIYYLNCTFGSGVTLYAKLPTDGSKTGTYTVNGLTITYAASSLTDSAYTLTTSSPGRSDGNLSLPISTSSLTDGSPTKSNAVTNV